MMTTENSYGRKAADIAIDLIYPRNLYIGIAASMAAWYGHSLSLTWTPYYGPLYFSKWYHDVFLDMVGKTAVTTRLASVFTHFATLYTYPAFMAQHGSQIHAAFQISAAVAASMTLNLIAHAVFGIKSDKNQQTESLEVALGISKTMTPLKPRRVKRHRAGSHKIAKKAGEVIKENGIKKRRVSTTRSTKLITAVNKTAIKAEISAPSAQPSNQSEEAEIRQLLDERNEQRTSQTIDGLNGLIIKAANFLCRC